MSDSRWQRIHELFDAARDLPQAERDAYVRAQAGGDDTLADEVLALLGAHGAPGRFDALLGRLAGLASTGPAPDDPERIGPYKILRRLGWGGMGAVYLAERDDGQFEHRVAIKVLRPDRAGPELRRRFLTERRILAQLTHENIAWLLDGNVTEEGAPYLVMEYVEGQPLLVYCDGERLSVTQRLRLFLDVCAAVAYAHRRLIVHRDLKPSNIMVTRDGTVKLLDFGIAKLLEDDATAGDATRTGHRVMTPEYAAPEQVRGDPVATTTDVYQLGVLLYELLTGRRPFTSEGGATTNLEQAILSTDPVRPSQAVAAVAADAATARGTTTDKLNRRLAGDLDHIVLKALRKEPDERYAAVTELAEDVRRHLDGRPVSARRGTWRYRASRFVRRNRVGVAAAALLLLSLVGGIAGTTWQAARASDQAAIAAAERDRARLEAEKARGLTDFLTGLFDVASEGNARADTLRLLPVLEAGAARLDDELRDQPDVRTAALIAVSDLYERLGRFEEAQRYAEEALRQRRETLDSFHPDVAEALDNLGGVLLDRGDVRGAGEQWAEAVRIRRAVRTAAGEAADSAILEQSATSLHNLAVARWRMRELALADSLESQAIALRDSAGTSRSSKMASSLDVLALVRRDLGREEEALELSRRALAIRREVLPNPHVELAVSMNNVATLLLDLRRFDEAEPLFRESLDIRRALLGDEHPQVATAIHNLGAVLKDLGRDDAAIARYEEALAMRRRLLGDEHLDIALSLSSIALLFHERGRCADALPRLEQAIPIWRKGLGAEHGLVYKTRGLRGDCLARLRRFADAEGELMPTYEGLIRVAGEDHSETRRVRQFLRTLYEAWGRPADAAKYADPGGG